MVVNAAVVTRGEVPHDLRSGSGSGYGYGYGDGYGYGYGYGSGSGYGYGYGYGDGDGDGSGDGYGDGDGDGSGYGDGDGDGYWEAVLGTFRTSGRAAFWKSNRRGEPANGGSGTKAAVGLVEEIAGPLTLCGPGALHATLDPSKWQGERLWVVALHGEVKEESDKLGALKREFLAEIPWSEHSFGGRPSSLGKAGSE